MAHPAPTHTEVDRCTRRCTVEHWWFTKANSMDSKAAEATGAINDCHWDRVHNYSVGSGGAATLHWGSHELWFVALLRGACNLRPHPVDFRKLENSCHRIPKRTIQNYTKPIKTIYSPKATPVTGKQELTISKFHTVQEIP